MADENDQVTSTNIRMRGLIHGGVLTLVCVVFYFLGLWRLAPLFTEYLGADIGGLIGKGLQLLWSLAAIISLLGGLLQFVIGKPIMFKTSLKEMLEKEQET